MKINVNTITGRQKLIIKKGLCDYDYIMKNWSKNDPDFQRVYYDFYLKARWAVMSKSTNMSDYFKLLQNLSKQPTLPTLPDVLDGLKKTIGSYEFSLGSKLLHTINNGASPIYDSKVRDYLATEEGVDFWWQRPQIQSTCPGGVCERCKILHDWEALNEWYSDFLTDPRGKDWVAWFDICFPCFTNISNVKKVDFIIFATQ